MGTCHCSRCRKLGATPLVFVAREHFTLIAGAEAIATVLPDPPYTYGRSFCGRCGTALGEPLSAAAPLPLNAHCLDDDPGLRNAFHEFVDEKPAWLVIGDDAAQFERHPQTEDVS